MPRFEDFDAHELRVITEAMEWSQSEFYDPGHAQDDRDTLHGLIEEAKAIRALIRAMERPARDDSISSDPYAIEAAGRYAKTDKKPETIGGFDRGGHPIIRRPDGSTERITHETPT